MWQTTTNEFQGSFFNLFQRQKRAQQFRVSFNVEHVLFSKFLKVIGFRDFFFGGGGGGGGGR